MDEKLTLNALQLMFHGLMGLLLGPFNGYEEKPIFEVGMGANLLDHELKEKNHDWLDFDVPNLDFFKNFLKRWVDHLLDHEPKKS
jgi:hypothetical protein